MAKVTGSNPVEPIVTFLSGRRAHLASSSWQRAGRTFAPVCPTPALLGVEVAGPRFIARWDGMLRATKVNRALGPVESGEISGRGEARCRRQLEFSSALD